MNTKYYQLSIITVLTSFLSITSANATVDNWDTPTPWGLATPTYYAGWDDFDLLPSDNTPDVAGSGFGAFTFGVNGSNLLSDSNVYTPSNNTVNAYQATLSAGLGGLYDVYLRMESAYSLPSDMTAYLVFNNNLSTSSVGAQQIFNIAPYIGSQQASTPLPANGLEYEYYWVWNNIPGVSVFDIWVSQNSQTVTITNLAEIAAISVTTAIPEPETYAMFIAGLGLIGFINRRKNKQA